MPRKRGISFAQPIISRRWSSEVSYWELLFDDSGYGQREEGTRARSGKGGGLTGSFPAPRRATE